MNCRYQLPTAVRTPSVLQKAPEMCESPLRAPCCHGTQLIVPKRHPGQTG